MTISIRDRRQENPDHVVASLDFKKAFCSTQRDHCLTVLRKLCPRQPQWLDVVSNLLARPTVINNPTAQNMGWPPPGGPMGTLIFSVVMTETVNNALHQLTSEVQALSYVDDAVLIGPAGAVNNAISRLTLGDSSGNGQPSSASHPCWCRQWQNSPQQAVAMPMDDPHHPWSCQATLAHKACKLWQSFFQKEGQVAWNPSVVSRWNFLRFCSEIWRGFGRNFAGIFRTRTIKAQTLREISEHFSQEKS